MRKRKPRRRLLTTAKRNLKADKRSYLESLAAEAENAASHGTMRDLYAAIRNLSGNYSKPERPEEDKDGQSISGSELEGRKRKWLEHFEELLNGPAPPDSSDIPPADSDLPIDCSATTKEEIQTAVKQLRYGTAGGPANDIPAEALKVDGRTNV